MQRTGLLSSRIQFKGEAQFADQQGIPPSEKYALGGMNSVRGYRKNILVKNNGVNSSLEWWFPLMHDNTSGTDILSIAPFIDYGRGWDSGNLMNAGKGYGTDLASYGIGMRWAWKGLSVDAFYGYGFVKSGITKGNDPQDQGFHFAVNWSVL
jgi:hemolysin activation/secretion protein